MRKYLEPGVLLAAQVRLVESLNPELLHGRTEVLGPASAYAPAVSRIAPVQPHARPCGRWALRFRPAHPLAWVDVAGPFRLQDPDLTHTPCGRGQDPSGSTP
jgi:hypothetical protein